MEINGNISVSSIDADRCSATVCISFNDFYHHFEVELDEKQLKALIMEAARPYLQKFLINVKAAMVEDSETPTRRVKAVETDDVF